MAITTLQGLINQVTANLQGEPKFTSNPLLPGLITQAINKGQDKIALETSYDIQEAVLPSAMVNGQYLMEYPLPVLAGTTNQPAWLAIHGASADDYEMRMMSLSEWQYGRAESTQITARPDRYWIRSMLFLDVYPRPSYQFDFKVFFSPKPLDMDLVNVPAMSVPFFCDDAIISYATFYCLQQNPSADGQIDPRATSFWQLFLKQVDQAKYNLVRNTHRDVRRSRRW